jgi:hypothetical protein
MSDLVSKLRYQGKQYSAGQWARGGGSDVHYLTQAADRIEALEQEVRELSVNAELQNDLVLEHKRVLELEAQLEEAKEVLKSVHYDLLVRAGFDTDGKRVVDLSASIWDKLKGLLDK